MIPTVYKVNFKFSFYISVDILTITCRFPNALKLFVLNLVVMHLILVSIVG